MTTLHFEYARLLVQDFPACFRFYRDVLELPVANGEEEGVYAEFDTGTVRLALFRRDFMAAVVGASDKPVVAEAQDRCVLTFGVENVDVAYALLTSRGAHAVTAPTDRPDWIIRTAHFRDPDGNLIEINASLPV